jgi:lipopolysaccharide exporter
MAALVNRLRTSIWRTIHGTGFARNVVVLTGGTALSQSLGVLTSPLLARLYAPEDFGVLGVYTSIFSVLAVVSALCYEQAIPLPEADEAAANLLALSLMIVLATSFLAGLGIVLWGEQITAWTNTPGLKSYLWLLPLSMLGAGAYQALNYWMARKRHFAILSYTKSVRTLGQVGMQVALGLVHLESTGLIIGHVASQFLGALSLLKHSNLQRSTIVPGKWPTLGKTYANFPLFTVWNSLINVVGIQAPVLLFARYFTLDTAGFFSQTMRVLGLPAALIGQAVAQVFYPRVARHEGEPSATGRFIQQVATSLLVLSFMVFSVVALYGADLFAWALGDQWDTAGLYAQYLAPWFMIAFVSSPLSSFALVKGKQRDNFFYGCFLTVSRLGAIWLGIRYASPDLSVILFSVVNALFYIAYIAWILNLAGSSLISWLRSIKVPVLGGILLLVGLLAVKSLLAPVVSLAVSTSGLGLFGLWFWLRSRRSAASE